MVIIVISRCEAVFMTEKGEKVALFHFKGAWEGRAVEAIKVKLDARGNILKGQEYLFPLILDTIKGSVIYGVIAQDGLQLLEF